MNAVVSALSLAAKAAEARAEARARRLAQRSVGYAIVGFAAAGAMVYGSIALFLHANTIYDASVAALLVATGWVLFALVTSVAIWTASAVERRRAPSANEDARQALAQLETALREHSPALAATAGVAAMVIAAQRRS